MVEEGREGGVSSEEAGDAMNVFDAIILAGEKEGSIPIRGRNKAFLRFGERPLVGWVVKALEDAERIRSITVVGPAEQLKAELFGLAVNKPLHFLEQGRNIFENMWHGALSTFPGYRPGITAQELAETSSPETAVAALTCDMPLIDPREVDHFLRTLPLDRADLIFGVTRQELLTPFAPRGSEPGITFLYFCVREFMVRHANIFCFRPLKLAHVLETYIPLIYRFRYQRRWRNVLAVAKESLRFSLPFGTLPLFFLLQFARVCDHHGWHRLRDFLRQPLPVAFLESHISKMLLTRFAVHQTIGPGLTLDIDDEESYQTFLVMAEKWKAIQENVIRQALAQEANPRL